MAQTEISVTTGEIALGMPRIQITWDTDLVPSESVTWLEKHGPLKEVLIQTERPSSQEAGYFVQTFDAYKNSDYTLLILDNGGENMRWLIFSMAPSATPGFWNDSEIWNDTDNWTD